jgi:cobalt-precorrin 5A hydrolase
MTKRFDHIALWALTSRGALLGRRVQAFFPKSILFAGKGAAGAMPNSQTFERLSGMLPQQFHRFDGHVFIMATGIVVRSIARLLEHKTSDPAVVVMDEEGQHAISLLSGHLGGANALARYIGSCIGARPVITTATDLRKVPAIDILAQEGHLSIENPEAIRHVSMALLEGQPVAVHDPCRHLGNTLGNWGIDLAEIGREPDIPGVWVDDIRVDLPPKILILRPPSLYVGVGCNRGTPATEINALLEHVLDQFGLSAGSIAGLASIDLKSDEKGLIELARKRSQPLTFFSKRQLAAVEAIETPSTVVERHVGVQSVCEAAAILASESGRLIVPKQTTPNVTIAIARKSFTSSE